MATNGATPTPSTVPGADPSLPMFAPSDPNVQNSTASNVDLDDLFRDCYFGDFNVNAAFAEPPTAESLPPPPAAPSVTTLPATTTTTTTTAATLTTTALPQHPPNPMAALPPAAVASVTAMPTNTTSSSAPPSSLAVKRPASEMTTSSSSASSSSAAAVDAATAASSKQLTDQQKVERRERNREHAKRSRLRKKFLLESLQEQIHGLQGEIDQLKNVIKKELPDKADKLLSELAGDKQKSQFTPLPMPSGFGPVKTLMEPDFRLMSALSGSQQNFAISDPSLPDNPIVYVSQGFLDLTGYQLDQVLGRNCRFLQGPGTDQSAVDVIRRGIREGVDTSVCLLNYKADGTPFWNQFFVAALRDAENNVVNFVGVQCEVSKAVVEKQLSESNNNNNNAGGGSGGAATAAPGAVTKTS